jgi:acetyltransferase
MQIELDTSEHIAALYDEFGKPILVHSLYGSLYADLRPKPLALIRERGIPVYDSLERAVRCLQALADFGEARKRPLPDANPKAVRSRRFEEVIATCRKEKRSVVLEHEARQALEDAGVEMSAPALVATTPGEAEQAFEKLGSVPVALKVVSRDIIHKTDAGGVKLNLSSPAAVRHAFAEIVENGQAYTMSHAGHAADIAGLLVTPMAPKGGIEIIIGVVRDPSYGPVLMFGLGGVLVEVLKDVVFRSLPLTEADARSMLGEIRAAQILEGVRGAQPVLAYPKGVGILDARILLEGRSPAVSSSH